MYSTDNGAKFLSWPDGGSTMFRGERTRGRKVASACRRSSAPGVIKPGTIYHEIGSHEDMLTTPLAATGVTPVKEDLLKGGKKRRGRRAEFV